MYQERIKKEFSRLKNIDSIRDVFSEAIELKRDGGVLLPICRLHEDDDILITKLGEWRRKHESTYPTRFPITFEGTQTWLRRKILATPDRILFLIVDKHGWPLGHLGYANCLNDKEEMEVDSVLRGEEGRARGIMADGMEVLMEWAQDTFHPRRFFLRVLEDNPQAIRFYERLGFTEEKRLPLRLHQDGERVSLKALEDSDSGQPDNHFVVMCRE